MEEKDEVILVDEEDVEDEEDKDESEEPKEEKPDEEDSEDEEGSEDEDHKDDKKEAKIVALKREAKEANKRIQELERAISEKNIDGQMQAQKDKMLNDGYSERDVEQFIKAFRENAILKQKQEQYEWDILSRKYPNIVKYRQEITEFRKTLPDASIEDVYLAKFSKGSAYDEKTRLEQEILYKRQQAESKSKGSIGGDKKPIEPTKLSASDERAYQIALKFSPSLTKSQFKKTLDEEELT